MYTIVLPGWERKKGRRGEGPETAEQQGWASKEQGFGSENCIPAGENIRALFILEKKYSEKLLHIIRSAHRILEVRYTCGFG